MKQHTHSYQFKLIFLILILALASLLYTLLVRGKLEQTSALFVGLPAFLAIASSYIPTKGSLTKGMIKAVLLFLFISGMFLGEGFVCIIFSTPLFVGIAGVIGTIIEKNKRKKKVRLYISIFLLPFVFEGMAYKNALVKDQQSVVVEKTIHSTKEINLNDIFNALPEFNIKQLPAFLNIGFPKPIYTQYLNKQTAQATDFCVHFAGGEGKPGNLCIQTKHLDHNSAQFEFISDSSHIAHWIQWKHSKINVKKIKQNKHGQFQYQVKWSFNYKRLLSPSMYFNPFEKYAVKKAGEYLLQGYFNHYSELEKI